MGRRWGSRGSAILSLLAITGLAAACLEGPEVATDDSAASNVHVVEPGGDDGAVTTRPRSTPPTTTTAEPSTTTEATTTTAEPSTTTETTTTETTTTTEATTTTEEPQPPAGPAYAAQSLAYVNQRRAEDGLHGLQVDPELTALAEGWARELAASQQLHHNPTCSTSGRSTTGRWVRTWPTARTPPPSTTAGGTAPATGRTS